MTSRITPRMNICLGFLISIVIGVNGDCGNPPRLSYAELVTPSQSGDTFKDGDVVQYQCLPGYRRVPSATSTSLTCSGSNWALPATPFCELRRCPAPEEIQNGDAQAEDVTFGSKVTYTCHEGYRFISKITTRECQADGTWSGVAPVCEAVVCQPPNPIPDGSYNPEKEDYSYSDAVTYTCKKDLSLIGSASIHCTSMGNWSDPEPECKVVSCPDPDIPNSERLSGFQGPYSLNSAITLKCKSGFTLIGPSSIKCEQNSQWSPSVPKCEITCAVPIVQNADVSAGLNDLYTQNSIVTFVCHNNYVMSGSKTVTCSANGQWEPSLPKCQLTCPNPNLKNAEELSPGPYTSDSTVTIVCLKNFTIRGSAKTKCNVNGQWDPSLPECLITCAVPIVQNADVSAGLNDLYTQNSIVTFVCHNNYVMSGSKTVTCSANGQWEPSLPKCQLTCPNPNLKNAEELSPGPYTSDSTVTIVCLKNFTIRGSAKTKCNVNGQWDPSLPECLRKEDEGAKDDNGSHVGAIVGGIVGAIVLIVAIIVGIVFYKRKQGKYNSSGNHDGKSASHHTPVDQAMNPIQSPDQHQEIQG